MPAVELEEGACREGVGEDEGGAGVEGGQTFEVPVWEVSNGVGWPEWPRVEVCSHALTRHDDVQEARLGWRQESIDSVLFASPMPAPLGLQTAPPDIPFGRCRSGVEEFVEADILDAWVGDARHADPVVLDRSGVLLVRHQVDNDVLAEGGETPELDVDEAADFSREEGEEGRGELGVCRVRSASQ